MSVHGKIDSTSDFTSRGLGELKAWLEPWFLGRGGDGGGTVVAGVTGLIAVWSGLMPPVTGNGTERRIPYDVDGSSLTFTLNSCWARVGSAGSFTSGWRLEKSPGGNSAFVPTTITSLTIAAANYEATAGAFSSSVSSGDVLRVVYTNVGSPILFHLQLEGHV